MESVDISVKARHVEVSNNVRSYAEEKASKLPRFFDRVQTIDVVIDKERDHLSVEMIVHAAGAQTFVAKEVGPDAHACIDLLVDKMERQLTKHKEKLKNHKHSGRGAETSMDTD
ncbi:MAG: ribosomal subunit interface protein [Phycisphaerae bacterium]|nr:MAG: ribosomal subunit interface protein [Phycisphaerae bacterium]